MPERKQGPSTRPTGLKKSVPQNQSEFMIPVGESDEEAVAAFIRACIVPILAEQFMHEREKPTSRFKTR